MLPGSGRASSPSRISIAAWLRVRPWIYVQLVLVTFALTPLFHRIVDWKTGYSQTSVLSLLPQIAMLPAAVLLVYCGGLGRVDKGLLTCAWLWFGGLAYAFVVGTTTGNTLPGLYTLLGFALPTFVGLWCASLDVSPRLIYEHVAGFLLALSTPICLYAVWQFAAPPPWDAAWMRDAHMDYIGIPEAFQLRPFSTLNGSPQFGDFLLFVVLFNLPKLRNVKLLAACQLALCAGTLVLTQVRADWITLGIAVLCYIALTPERVRNFAVVASLVAVCVVAAANAPLLFGSDAAGEGIQARFASFWNLGTDVSVNERQSYFGDTLSMALSQPTGEGLGVTGQGARLGASGADIPYDDGYIARFIEMGYFGMACYIVTLFVAFAITFRRWRFANAAGSIDDAAILAAFVSIQVALLVLDASIDHHNQLPGVFFWLTLALAYRWRDDPAARDSAHGRVPATSRVA